MATARTLRSGQATRRGPSRWTACLIVVASLAATLSIGAPTGTASPNATIDADSSDASRAAAALSGKRSRVRADVNGDGYVDLIVGRARARANGVRGGIVRVVPGGPNGLERRNAVALTLAPGAHGDRFGAAIAVGDVNGDGFADIAIGAPGRSVLGNDDAGSVVIHLGSRKGVSKRAAVVLVQGSRAGDRPEPGDGFGSSLAIGDFDGDGAADLAIGTPGEDSSRGIDTGLVQVYPGSRRGLSSRSSWTSAGLGTTLGVTGSHLGTALAAGDLDGDGRADLVVGSAGGGTRRGRTSVEVSLIVRGDRRGLRNANAEIVVGRADRPTRPAEPAGDQPEWLQAVNRYRSQAGLDPVTEQRSLSIAALTHSRWMVRNGIVSHDAAGGGAGGRSVVMGSTSSAATDLGAVNSWITGPFHALYLLHPGLERVGFGSYRQDDAPCGPSGCIRMGATLDVLSSRSDRSIDDAIAWPGDGAVVGVNQHHQGERPDPQSACPGAHGLPILAMFPRDATIDRATFTSASGDVLPSCSFDASSYDNPIGAEESLGRSILGASNAVVLMPEGRLRQGEGYCYDIRTTGGRVRGCFEVDLS